MKTSNRKEIKIMKIIDSLVIILFFVNVYLLGINTFTLCLGAVAALSFCSFFVKLSNKTMRALNTAFVSIVLIWLLFAI